MIHPTYLGEVKDLVLKLIDMSGQPGLNCRRALSACGMDLIKANEYLTRYTWDSHGFRVLKEGFNGR